MNYFGEIPYQNAVQNVQNQIIQENMQQNLLQQNLLQGQPLNQNRINLNTNAMQQGIPPMNHLGLYSKQQIDNNLQNQIGLAPNVVESKSCYN